MTEEQLAQSQLLQAGQQGPSIRSDIVRICTCRMGWVRLTSESRSSWSSSHGGTFGTSDKPSQRE